MSLGLPWPQKAGGSTCSKSPTANRTSAVTSKRTRAKQRRVLCHSVNPPSLTSGKLCAALASPSQKEQRQAPQEGALCECNSLPQGTVDARSSDRFPVSPGKPKTALGVKKRCMPLLPPGSLPLSKCCSKKYWARWTFHTTRANILHYHRCSQHTCVYIDIDIDIFHQTQSIASFSQQEFCWDFL